MPVRGALLSDCKEEGHDFSAEDDALAPISDVISQYLISLTHMSVPAAELPLSKLPACLAHYFPDIASFDMP